MFTSNDVEKLALEIEESIENVLLDIDKMARINSRKVHSAFIKNGVSDTHFVSTSGYGYDDRGREVLDCVFADVFKSEAALVRHFMLSGTHALTVSLFGILRPNDVMLSLAGKPYDTLDAVIGLSSKGSGSLRDFGVIYSEVALDSDGRLDFVTIENELRKQPKMAYLQRSRGYDTRPSIMIDEIEKVAVLIKKISPNTIFFVDNCYGEFVEEKEPCEVGADLIAGSLIKNAGGSFAESGGYIAGRKDLVEMCAQRLTAPGLGSEVGASLGQNKSLFRGIYFAPSITANAAKTAVFAAAMFEKLGFETSPSWNDKRTDIVQQIYLKSAKNLCAFCEGIQAMSAIDSFVTPTPAYMPGYTSDVIMAAGAFVSGSSIELSADAPLREPYCVYMQGGIIYDNAVLGVMEAAKRVLS